MKIRIDLKIFIFFALFYFTKQIDIYFIIIFFCIIHELGHIIMGLILNFKPDKLEIKPYGLSISFKINIEDINIKIGNGNLLELKQIIVAISGPVVSLLLIILYSYIDPIYITKQDAIYSNILILLFNLLPLYPLDGGRILNSIFYMKYGNRVSKVFTYKCSNITMIIITIFSSIFIYYFKNISIFLICICLWIMRTKENKIFHKKMKIYDLIESSN